MKTSKKRAVSNQYAAGITFNYCLTLHDSYVYSQNVKQQIIHSNICMKIHSSLKRMWKYVWLNATVYLKIRFKMLESKNAL